MFAAYVKIHFYLKEYRRNRMSKVISRDGINKLVYLQFLFVTFYRRYLAIFGEKKEL